MDENKAAKWAHNADMFIGLTPYLGAKHIELSWFWGANGVDCV